MSRKTNHLAVLGFLLPFAAAGAAAALILLFRHDLHSTRFRAAFLILVPAFLLSGLISAIRSLPLIQERDDRDYAYSGLALNLIFLAMFLITAAAFLLASP